MQSGHVHRRLLEFFPFFGFGFGFGFGLEREGDGKGVASGTDRGLNCHPISAYIFTTAEERSRILVRGYLYRCHR